MSDHDDNLPGPDPDPQAGAGGPLKDPADLKRLVEREKELAAAEDLERAEAEAAQRKRRDEANALNYAEMERQRREGPHPDVVRRLEEARAAKSEPAPPRPSGGKRPKPTGKRRPPAPTEAARAPSAAELATELQNATGTSAILQVLSRACWWHTHDGAACPDNRIPKWPELIAWWDKHAESVAREAREALAAVLGAGAIWMPWPLGSDQPLDVRATHPTIITVRKSGTVDLPFLDMPEVHRRWAALAVPHPHPLAPVVEAWQRRPVEVLIETRADRRIMPALLRMIGPSPERERGMLFGGLVEDRPRSAELSLFPELEPTRHRVPLLEIVDRTGVPIRSSGRGAPLEARLLVRGGLLMIRPEDRHLETVRIAVTVRELLDGLWPPRRDKRGNVARDPGRNWPKLRDALYRARDWTVPDAGGGRWFPMALRRLPAGAEEETPSLDDLVVVDLAPVPGAVHGASVDLPWLDRMGVTSGPKWRAYIAGRSLIWLPGTTRRPVPHTGGKRHGWSRNPDDYPVLTFDDQRRLAFGRDDKHRTRAEILAPWLNLPDLTLTEATDPRTGILGWRLMPTDRGE